MVVDTSAVLAVVLGQSEAGRVLEALVDAERVRMSAATWCELASVVESRGGRLAGLKLDSFLAEAGAEIVAVTPEQAATARNAWRYFGGRLDLLDCFAYALAKDLGETLLHADAAFERTDCEPALKDL